MNEYKRWQVDCCLDLYYRDHRREMPWRYIAEHMKVDSTPTALERLRWGCITGYGNPVPGKEDEDLRYRKEYTPSKRRLSRKGQAWYPREDDALKHALKRAGQTRVPVCDIPYIAAVLARTEAEVAERWAKINKDPLGREGFGLGKK